ncbi:M48 family metalloprotease [Baekduia sp. Peel2402]|uniref:M48 family metalloprotease n=1 Tax=Baekduia sp. Peel2402 TaxID=3458296 RepID=UPI00403E5FEA
MGDKTFGLTGKGSPVTAILLVAIGLVFTPFLAGAGDAIASTAGAIGVAVLALLGFGTLVRRELNRSRGVRRLTISADRITIEHPDPLRAPLHLPRELIRAIAIDESGDPHVRLPVVREFSWSAPTAAPDGLEGFLWTSSDGDTLLPVLGGPKDKPTVAIVLRHPATFEAARAARARGADARNGRTTLDRERHVIGLMLAVADPAALTAALADWPERVEAITTSHFRPEPEDAAQPAAAATSETPAPPAQAPPPPTPLASVAPPPSTPAPEPTVDALDLPQPRSVAATRRVALLLALGFAIPFALLNAGLFGLSFWMLSSGRHMWFWLPAGLAIGMLYAVLYREPGDEPGVPLDAAAAPELHAFIADVAAQIEAPVPTAVRLTLAPQDAISASHDGATLYLGLPALAVYDRDALRALIAHELAHHGRRHTGVGVITGWTFTALDRLHRHLLDLEHGGRLLAYPAAGARAMTGRYAAFAAPIVIALRRHHEIEADHVASAAVGPAVAIAELERYYALSEAFDGWTADVLLPALESGHRPPLAAGFAAYLERPEVRRRTEAAVDAGRCLLTLDPARTHPPLGVRLAIARSVPAVARPRDRRPAIALLDRLDLREQELLAGFAGADRVATLQPVQAAA